jgi:hypothetical protein
MVDLSDSIARKTVHFGQSLSGRELIEAVKAACGDSFHQEMRYDDGERYLIGQRSAYPYENLLVTPSKTSASIDPEETYDSAVVVRHDALSPGSMYSVRYDRGFEIRAVLDFAEKLPQFLPGGQQQVGPEVSRDPYAPAAGATRRDAAAQARPGHGTPTAGARDTQTRDPRS